MLDWQEEELERMAGSDWKKREACKMAAWIKPKADHKRMVSRLLQVRAHLILCFRAEQKIEMVKGVDGRMEIQPKKLASGFSDWIPICDKNLLYELTSSFLLTPDAPGIPKPIKLEAQHRALIDLKNPLDETVGERLAEWARGGKAPDLKAPEPPLEPTDDLDMAILFNDLALEIQGAETVKTASEIYNNAVDQAQLPERKMTALREVLKDKMAQLKKGK